MSGLEITIRGAGVSLLLLAGMHLFLPKRLGWPEDFAKVSPLNRQIFYVHCFFVCLVVVFMGLGCLVWPQTLMQPTLLGMLVCGGLAIFWIIRLFMQFFIYSDLHWKGKRFETVAHVCFSGLWSFYAALFSLLWWLQWRAR
ncbi:hypothetical protein BH09VER1_BH09VER1_01400 [soil metagenome]